MATKKKKNKVIKKLIVKDNPINYESQLPDLNDSSNVNKKPAEKPIQKTVQKPIQDSEEEPENTEEDKGQKKDAKQLFAIKKLPVEERKTMMTEKQIAMDFAIKAQQKFDRMIKASILFGSQAKNEAQANSDIDIVIVIDDASINWDIELISWYREELGKLITAQKYAKELHINTIKLTTWWQDMLNGDPVIINILRYGEALIDSGGFYNPLKSLLLQGKIKSTTEAVYAALQRAPSHLIRSRTAVISAIEGVYWTMVDSAQAALIMANKSPPSPEHIPEMLAETFVEKGMLKINYVRAIKDLYLIHKGISHGNMRRIKGAEIDRWQETAESFLNEMTRIINILLETKK